VEFEVTNDRRPETIVWSITGNDWTWGFVKDPITQDRPLKMAAEVVRFRHHAKRMTDFWRAP